jgi:hypothetical protein
VAQKGSCAVQNTATATPRQVIWRLRNQISDRTWPVPFITTGAIQVAGSTKMAESSRSRAALVEV